MTTYHIVCDVRNRILSIHQILDAAIATFEKIIKEDTYEEVIYINTVITNQYGRVVSEVLVRTHVKAEGIIQEHSIYIHNMR
jgi:hypothetical protein